MAMDNIKAMATRIRSTAATGAGIGAVGFTMLTADEGNPLVNAAGGAVLGGAIGGVKGVVNEVQDYRANKREAARKAAQAEFLRNFPRKNRNLGRQFD